MREQTQTHTFPREGSAGEGTNTTTHTPSLRTARGQPVREQTQPHTFSPSTSRGRYRRASHYSATYHPCRLSNRRGKLPPKSISKHAQQNYRHYFLIRHRLAHVEILNQGCQDLRLPCCLVSSKRERVSLTRLVRRRRRSPRPWFEFLKRLLGLM